MRRMTRQKQLKSWKGKREKKGSTNSAHTKAKGRGRLRLQAGVIRLDQTISHRRGGAGRACGGGGGGGREGRRDDAHGCHVAPAAIHPPTHPAKLVGHESLNP